MNSPYTDARADYDKAVVGRDNTWYSDLAAADKTWAVAEAGARRDHGAAGVGAEAGYQRQLAMIDLNWQIALRTGYASYYTYPISQLQQSALDQKTHAQQAADLRQAIGDADAALAFAIGMAGSDKTWTKGVSSDSKDLRSGLAGADQAYATGMIQPAVTCDLGYMSATIGLWNRERLWGNAWNSAIGAASADFRGADLAARATALSGLASAINNPWARFQSDRANAESAWWSGTATTTGFRATYLQWFANANGAYTLYQDTVNSLYMSHEGSRIAADSSYTADVANATAACENWLADEDKRYQHTMADATHTYVVAAAQTRHDSAIAQAMQALGLATANPSIYSSQMAAAQNAYASSEVGATATWRTGVANANLTYVTDTANCENAWVLNVAAANKTYSIGEATAYAAMGVSLAGHQRTYREQEAQTYATALSTLATTSGTPWAQLAADEASARSGYLQDVGQPWLDYTTSLINAQRDTETAGASALETLIATRANAAKTSRIAAAQAALTRSAALNAADAALLSSGRYAPNLPANIVDSLFTASSFSDLTDLTDPSDYQPVRSPDGTYDWLLGQAFTTAPCLSSPLTGDGYAWSGYYTPPTNSDSLRDQLIRPKPPEVKLDGLLSQTPTVAGTLGTTSPEIILCAHNGGRKSKATEGRHRHGEKFDKTTGRNKAQRDANTASKGIEGREAYEASRSVSEVNKQIADETVKELNKELRAKQDLILKASRQRRITLEKEADAIQREIEAWEKLAKTTDQTRDAAMEVIRRDAKAVVRKAEMTLAQKCLQRALQNMGRALVVGGFVVTIWAWESRAEEVGAARATVEAVPVLGDIVVLTENYMEMHELLDETVAAYGLAEQIDKEAAENQRRWAATRTIAAYNRIAAEIKVYRPEYIDAQAIGVAAQVHQNTVLHIMILVGHGQMSSNQGRERLKEAEEQFRQAVIRAANQRQEVQQPSGPMT